jgi:branched-subunit amino acid aminotransferase/4-amino-4-deoxychorismate lyase
VKDVLWLNGRFLAARDAWIPALDRGLLHGDGVYDTWRTYGGEPFAVAAHRRRLSAATRRLALPAPAAVNVLTRLTRVLLRRNGLADGAVRLTLTRGAAGVGPAPDTRARPLRLLTVRPLPADLVRRQQQGIAVVLLPFPRDAHPFWGDVKFVGHPSMTLGRQIASRRHADEGLYVTPAGEVTEATTANLVLVERDTLVTPPISAGILAGVTRGLVLQLAARLGLTIREEPITVARLRRARECLLTASTIEIVPVTRLDGRRLGTGHVGATTAALQAAYQAHVRRTVGRAAT